MLSKSTKFAFQKSTLNRTTLIFLFTASVLFGAYLYQLNNSWLYLGKQALDFGDLKYVLDRADCVEQVGRSIFNIQTPINTCSNYIYGYPLLQIFHLLRLSGEIVFPFGVILFLGLSLIFSSFISLRWNPLDTIIIFIIAMSPPVILLIERANIDLFLVLILIFAALIFSKGYEATTFTILIILSIFKFYFLPLAVFLLIKKRRKIGKSIFLYAIFFCGSYSIMSDLKSIHNIPWDAKNEFGNVIWGEYLAFIMHGNHSHGNYIYSQIIGITLLIPIFLASKRYFKNTEFSGFVNTSKPDTCSTIFEFFSITFLSCYFLGLNIDYRLIYLAISLFSLMKCRYLSPKNEKVLCLLAFVVFFSSYNTYLAQPVGDFSLLFIIVILILILRNGTMFKNFNFIQLKKLQFF